eukprot:GEMP01038859.1.p1 GENE.GEMP01038859.1~~GEMP01038859.1.p1  ORF type:complete len:443 (+),score=76.14 GEMP01038859.1:37-1365(+)
MYSGIVKSFNARRGFGFLVCDETTEKYRRDVFISKGECDTEGLQEGDICTFDLMLSTEGHPQALNAKKCQRYEGRVIGTTMDRPISLGPVNRKTWPGPDILPSVEMEVPESEIGILVLHSNDKVTFSVNTDDKQRPFATKVSLVEAASSRELNSCFELEDPLPCRGHSIDNQVIFSLPSHFDVELLKVVLPKVLNHRSLGLPRSEGNNDIATLRMRPPSSLQRDSFWPAPFLTQIEDQVTWEPQIAACTYALDVRVPKKSSWVRLDADGKPVSWAILNASVNAVKIGLLGPILEARLSYMSACGCCSDFETVSVKNVWRQQSEMNTMCTSAPMPPEVLRHTQRGTTIRWQAQPDVSEYMIEVMHGTGEIRTQTVSNQAYVELEGYDILWARVACLRHNRLSPYSNRLMIPPRTTWTVDEASGVPRLRSPWDDCREAITVWLD